LATHLFPPFSPGQNLAVAEAASKQRTRVFMVSLEEGLIGTMA